MFSRASAISCAAWRAMAAISGLAPLMWEVTASEPTIRPVIGCLTGAPAHASSASAALKCSAPRTNTHVPRLDGRAEPVGPQRLFGEVEALYRVGPIHGPLVLRVDDAAGDDAAGLVGEEQGHPRIGQIGLPVVQDPTRGAQDNAVRVDLPENLGSGLGVNVRRDRAPPALLDLFGDERWRDGSPK